MEQNSSELKVSSISVASQQLIDYVRARKDHTIESLKTHWHKFNQCCMGGIEPNTVYTITGISGSGKSSFVNTIETDLIDQNPGKDIIVLSFTLEMISYRQIGRKITSKLLKTTSELYSSYKDLDDATFGAVVDVASKFKSYPIYYVDQSGTPDQVKKTIISFYNKYVKDTNKYFIIIYDHVLLTNQAGSVIETVSALQKIFIEVKKLPLTSVIQIAQMNREIEKPDRISNPSMHFPMRSDISSSDSIFQASDYVLVIHRPEILGIQGYGINRWRTDNKVFLHLIKNRDAGKPVILQFENNLVYNDLIESSEDGNSTT
jgi:replicative DNA helicase